MADGHLGKCKDCAKADVAQNYADNREEKSHYEHKRNKTPHRRAAKMRYQATHRAKHPERYAARMAVGNAIRGGRLIRLPCRIQPCERKGQAHHRDYSRPLDVDWLCFKHHRESEHGQTVSV